MSKDRSVHAVLAHRCNKQFIELVLCNYGKLLLDSVLVSIIGQCFGFYIQRLMSVYYFSLQRFSHSISTGMMKWTSY